ncbi:HaeIII family restriction endonuclease [Yersinia enterocolitica]|jgi:hypothetical protein|nr:HaeIII family restriction endonuclease [Yersinia enterocolitica]
MASKSNDNGRAFEYCLAKYILDNSLDEISIDSETRYQQDRDRNKYETLPIELKNIFDRASRKYFDLLPTTICSLRRLSDSEGRSGNPADIEITFTENGLRITKNISLKSNHNAVKHQRPGALISQLGISNKDEDISYRAQIKSLESSFISSIDRLGFNTTNELLFSDIKLRSDQAILDLYNNFCSLTASIINKFGHACAGNYFHFLVSKTDFEKLIVYPNNIVIEEWYKLQTPTEMIARVLNSSYVIVEFNNGYSFNMRLHNASSRFKKGTSLSLKFDTRIEVHTDIPKSIHRI